MDSMSRISPSRITSGASRSAARRARAKVGASLGTSLWLTRDFLWLWMYSMGSSMVTMWPVRSRLMRSIMQARVVLLPLPAGPVTRIMPFRFLVSSITRSGTPSSRGSGRPKATMRSVAATVPRWI